MDFNLKDDYELRFRHPSVHQMSFDGEISYLIARPEANNTAEIDDEGAMVCNRLSQSTFREIFLNLFPENKFVKVTLFEFSVLQRTTIFSTEGKLLGKNWFNENREKIQENNAT